MGKKSGIFFGWVAVLLLGLTMPIWADGPSASEQILTIDACLQLGFANSPDLKKQAQNVAIAQEGVRQAKADFLPAVNLGLNYTSENGSVYKVEQAFGYPSAFPSGSLQVDLPLFRMGKLSNSLKAAMLQFERTKQDERQAKLEVTYNIKKAFYELWFKEQELLVAQASVANLSQHFDEVTKYFQAGRKSKYELLESEVALRDQKARTISAQSEVALAKLDLATLIGIDKDRDFEISCATSAVKLPEVFELNLKALLDLAYLHRPDMCQSLQDMQIAALNVEIARAVNRPAAFISYQNQDIDFSSSDLSNMWLITLGVNFPLFNGESTASKVKQAEEKAVIAGINAADIKDQARRSVQKTFQTLEVDWQTALAYQANIDLAKEALRMAELRYSVGMATDLDIKDAQLAVDQAADSYYQKVAAYLTDLAGINLVTGQE